MSDADKQKMDELRNEVVKLREELNKINSEKEKHFSEKEKLNKQIADLIKQVKEKKSARDEINSEVKLTKEKRDELVGKLTEKIEAIKKIKRPEMPVQKPSYDEGRGRDRDRPKRKLTPPEIKKEIESLEHKIETEGLSFDKEQKMMKLIKEKKKELAEIEKAHSASGEYYKLDAEIKDIKRELNQETKGQKNRAKESQGNHEEMISISKEIDELKRKEKEEFDQFVEFKKQFKDINDKLKEKLTALGETSEKMGVEIKEKKERKQKEQKQKESVDLSKLREEVRGKMKRGEKLTTADLIVFQGEEE